MNKFQASILLVLIYTMASVLGAMEPEPESLVVGSMREAQFVGSWWKKMQGEGGDFSHRQTFGGKAVSLDLKKCTLKNLPHRIADARTYRPKGKIKQVFMELFPSSVEGDKIGTTTHGANDLEVALTQLLLMPDVIKNLATYMEPGCTLEIEHIPHSAYISKGYGNAFRIFQSANPFHSFVSDFTLGALRARNIDIRNDMNAYVKYWDEIKKKELEEYEDLEDLINASAISVTYLKQAIKHIKKYTKFKSKSIEDRIDQEIVSCEQIGWPQFLDTYGPNSIITCITQIASILEQQELMIAFLKEIGFKDVKVEIKDNDYNQRKNVFMISAIKI